MKSLITALSFIALFAATTSSQATSIEYTGVTAHLTNIQLGKNFPHQIAYPFTKGNITINQQAGYVQLDLAGPAGTCPDNTPCFLPTNHANIVLKLLGFQNSSCGVTYTAQGNFSGQSSNGVVETIIVTDYTNATCKMVFPASTVIKYYYQIDGTTRYGISNFYGAELTPYLRTYNTY